LNRATAIDGTVRAGAHWLFRGTPDGDFGPLGRAGPLRRDRLPVARLLQSWWTSAPLHINDKVQHVCSNLALSFLPVIGFRIAAEGLGQDSRCSFWESPLEGVSTSRPAARWSSCPRQRCRRQLRRPSGPTHPHTDRHSLGRAQFPPARLIPITIWFLPFVTHRAGGAPEGHVRDASLAIQW